MCADRVRLERADHPHGSHRRLIAQFAALAWMVSDITGSSSSTAAVGFLAVPPALFVLAVVTVVIDALARVVRRIVRPPKPPSLAPGSGDDWSGLPPPG